MGMDDNSRSDADLLALEDPDGSAFAIFYQRHIRVLLGAMHRRGVEPAMAADIAADTFLAALVHRGDFDPHRGSARGWLFGIQRNKMADHHRRRAQNERLRDRLGFALPELTQAEYDDCGALDQIEDEMVNTDGAEAALASLPAAQRSAIRGRVVAEISYPKLAESLGVSEPTVRQHVSRGLSALRRQVKKP